MAPRFLLPTVLGTLLGLVAGVASDVAWAQFPLPGQMHPGMQQKKKQKDQRQVIRGAQGPVMPHMPYPYGYPYQRGQQNQAGKIPAKRLQKLPDIAECARQGHTSHPPGG